MMVCMESAVISEELRQWVAEQQRQGVSRDSMLTSMQGSGWQEGMAVQVLTSLLASSCPCPDPDLSLSPSEIVLDGHSTEVLLSLKQPRVVLLGHFLSDDECDELIVLAKSRLQRSETVDETTGGSAVHEARTSEGMFFTRGSFPLIKRIEARIAALTHWPVENGEGLQILRYRPGAQYKPHYDYFDISLPSTSAILRRGGQRMATLVMYLNTPVRGGSTSFPDIGLDILPRKGSALFFSYPVASTASLTLHGGSEVLEGEKWVATKWLREARFD
jgi:prolyl 4-hydroxylase